MNFTENEKYNLIWGLELLIKDKEKFLKNGILVLNMEKDIEELKELIEKIKKVINTFAKMGGQNGGIRFYKK